MSNIPGILERMSQGDSQAARELLPLVYNELRQLAAWKMACERPQTLQPTALVHEAWLRISNAERSFSNRTHFFNAAAEAMRRILIERARRRQRLRHGGGQERVDVNDLEIAAPESDERLLAVQEALDLLAAEDPIKARVVTLRYFAGLSTSETADALGISERTVERHWAYAKAWLFWQIGQDAGRSFGQQPDD